MLQWCGHCKNLAPEYAKVADLFKDAKSQVLIVKVDADANKETAKMFDITGFPTLKWFEKGSDAKKAQADYDFKDYDGERSAEALIDFVNGKTGLSRKLKVAPSFVHALTPETFDTIVSNDAAFKLLEFYAPWCGHCKSLAPTYEQLGGVFAGEKNVVIAKIDADKHRSLGERFGVEGFPTIKFLAPGALASGSKPETAAEPYNGPRDLAGLVAFVNEKAGTHRDEKGGLLATAGLVSSLADEALALGTAPSAAALSALKTAVGGLTGEEEKAFGGLYVKLGEKIVEKGVGYIAKETARLTSMLASEEIKAEKKTELAYKRNILASFLSSPDSDADL